MPLTLAHPAAILPVRRLLRKWTDLSALVIGSMTPDFAYVLPVAREDSHSLTGILWFCLPVGCAVYLVFHRWVKRPLLSLLPVDIARRLTPLVLAPRASNPWTTVVSLLLGALTHIAWDACTHRDGAVVTALEFPHTLLVTVGTYQVFVYKVLQHASTAAGMVILYYVCRRWLRAAAVGPVPAVSLQSWQRFAGIAFLAGIPAVCGLVAAITNLSSPLAGAGLQVAVGKGVLAASASLAAAVLVFSVWWHLRLPRSGMSQT